MRGGERDEPGVGVLGVRRVRAAARRCRSCRRPRRRAARPRCRCPSARRSSIIARTWRATRRGTARWRRPGRAWRSAARARRPPSAIVAPTPAIASGVARSRSWPIAAAPTARLSRRLRTGDRARLRRRYRSLRRSSNPNAPRGRDEPLGAELGAERREHRVARLDERLGQRAAAGLVARVAQLDARRAPRTCGPDTCSAGVAIPRRARPETRDDLERRAGRLGRGHRQPGEREHRAVARAHDRDAAELRPPARRPPRCMSPGRIVVCSVRPAHRRRARDDARAEQQPRRRVAAEARVVEALQAGRRRPGATGDRRAERVASSGVPSAARISARRRLRALLAAHGLAAPQARQPQRRVPRDAGRRTGAVDRQRDRPAQDAERRCRDRDRHCHGAAVDPAGPPRNDRPHARRAVRGPHEHSEPPLREPLLRLRIQRSPHPGDVATRPSPDIALRCRPLPAATVRQQVRGGAGRREHHDQPED